jgi:hypothetical protein
VFTQHQRHRGQLVELTIIKRFRGRGFLRERRDGGLEKGQKSCWSGKRQTPAGSDAIGRVLLPPIFSLGHGSL